MRGDSNANHGTNEQPHHLVVRRVAQVLRLLRRRRREPIVDEHGETDVERAQKSKHREHDAHAGARRVVHAEHEADEAVPAREALALTSMPEDEVILEVVDESPGGYSSRFTFNF